MAPVFVTLKVTVGVRVPSRVHELTHRRQCTLCHLRAVKLAGVIDALAPQAAADASVRRTHDFGNRLLVAVDVDDTGSDFRAAGHQKTAAALRARVAAVELTRIAAVVQARVVDVAVETFARQTGPLVKQLLTRLLQLTQVAVAGVISAAYRVGVGWARGTSRHAQRRVDAARLRVDSPRSDLLAYPARRHAKDRARLTTTVAAHLAIETAVPRRAADQL